MKRASRPMQRKDWAWVMACVVCGLLVAAFALIPEIIWENQKHYGTKYTFTTKDDGTTFQSVEQFEVPIYSREITIRTGGQTEDIIRAISALKRDDIDVHNKSLFPNHTSLQDVFSVTVGAFLFFFIGTALFRIIEKICGRILGVKPPADDIENVKAP